MNKKLFTGFMIASMFFILVIFFQTCSVNSKLKTVKLQNTELKKSIDSLIIVQDKKEIIIPATPNDIKQEVQKVMYDFLIYEDDLDKNKISLSLIKHKIEEDDKK